MPTAQERKEKIEDQVRWAERGVSSCSRQERLDIAEYMLIEGISEEDAKAYEAERFALIRKYTEKIG